MIYGMAYGMVRMVYPFSLKLCMFFERDENKLNKRLVKAYLGPDLAVSLIIIFLNRLTQHTL